MYYRQFKNYFFNRHLLFNKNTCYKNISVIEPGTVYTLGVKGFEFFSQKSDNPLNWISKSRMEKYSTMTEKQIMNYLEKVIVNQLKILIPYKKLKFIDK